MTKGMSVSFVSLMNSVLEQVLHPLSAAVPLVPALRFAY